MNRYEMILKPLKIKGKVMKSRIMCTDIQPWFLQGPEPYPTEAVIRYYGDIAANGAGIVTCHGGGLRDRVPRMERDWPPARGNTDYDIYDPAVQNYFSQLADTIHFHDSLACVSLGLAFPMGVLIAEPTPDVLEKLGDHAPLIMHGNHVVTREEIKATIAGTAEQAKIYQNLGFDCCELHMSYNCFITALAMSRVINTRTDEYGGQTFENRFRIAMELIQAIRDACGPDFIIVVHVSAEEPFEGGYQLDDIIRFAKETEGLIDILQIRMGDIISAHPTGFNSTMRTPPTLPAAAALKAQGLSTLISTVGGFQDPDFIEEVLEEGSVDIVAMARAFYSNWDNYYRCLVEETPEDLIPCLRCLKCSGPSIPGTKLNLCSVNPRMGTRSDRLAAQIQPPKRKKRVAVIGGGPAGMQAALYLRQRGHEVTLFEKSDSLGGQLKHADFADFKWPVRDFKDYLICQMKKTGVDVRLNTEATPEKITPEQYDAVVAATGAVPKLPSIKGVDTVPLWLPIDVFGQEEKLGHRVAVVGGGETAVETGLYLARSGHEVTLLTRQDLPAKESIPFVHYGETIQKVCRETEHFRVITNAVTTQLEEKQLIYLDKDGARQTLAYDDVVVSGGSRGLTDEALAFAGRTAEFYIVGDAKSPGSILTCTKTAFAAASHI